MSICNTFYDNKDGNKLPTNHHLTTCFRVWHHYWSSVLLANDGNYFSLKYCTVLLLVYRHSTVDILARILIYLFPFLYYFSSTKCWVVIKRNIVNYEQNSTVIMRANIFWMDTKINLKEKKDGLSFK